MGALLGLAQIAGTIYIFYNAWKGTTKKFFMKIFCIITGFLNAYTIIYCYFQGKWGNMIYSGVGLVITISIPIIAKSLENRNKL